MKRPDDGCVNETTRNHASETGGIEELNPPGRPDHVQLHDHDQHNHNEAIMIFTSSLVRQIESPQTRLPANFVGVRRVRPSSTTIGMTTKVGHPTATKDFIAQHDKNDPSKSNFVKFVVVDEDGNERRMTSAEKKAKKLQLAEERKKHYRKEKQSRVDVCNAKQTLDKLENGDDVVEARTTNDDAHEGHATNGVHQSDDPASKPEPTGTLQSKVYHQLPLNPTAMEQELAELRGDRSGLPPVILSPPIALQFRRGLQMIGVMCSNAFSGIATQAHAFDGDGCAIMVYDHNLSQRWAEVLHKDCIEPAEIVRQREDLRPLAYRLHPEPWQRLRPTLRETPLETSKRHRFVNNIDDDKDSDDDNLKRDNDPSITSKEQPKLRTTIVDPPMQVPNSCEWMSTVCRPTTTSPPSNDQSRFSTPDQNAHDCILSIVFEYIHRETPYYVSCGAKFGADFLIYDGPRDERHAFAGLKVLTAATTSTTTAKSQSRQDSTPQLPLPTAYSLTSFVRCLNTAGKVALLATAVSTIEILDENSHSNGTQQSTSIIEASGGENKNSQRSRDKYQVLFVDIALEKVLDAPTHKRRRGGSSANAKKRRDVTQNLAKAN